jgi:hypothetical protein
MPKPLERIALRQHGNRRNLPTRTAARRTVPENRAGL